MRAVLEPAALRRYDELNDAQGTMRPHWRRLLSRLRADESPDAVRRSLELTRRLIVENGVTYNIYGDPNGLNRPWQLDTVPLMIRNSDWKVVEKGMKQRAFVLDKVLEDLYGERKLLKEKIIPISSILIRDSYGLATRSVCPDRIN